MTKSCQVCGKGLPNARGNRKYCTECAPKIHKQQSNTVKRDQQMGQEFLKSGIYKRAYQHADIMRSQNPVEIINSILRGRAVYLPATFLNSIEDLPKHEPDETPGPEIQGLDKGQPRQDTQDGGADTRGVILLGYSGCVD